MKKKYINFCKKYKLALIVLALVLLLVNVFIFTTKKKNNELTFFYNGKIFTIQKRDAESQTFLNLKLLQMADSINVEAVSASPDFKNNIDKIIPEKDGLRINTDKLTVLIADNIKKPPFYPLAVPTIRTFAGKYSAADLAPIKKQAVELSKNPIVITVKGNDFVLNTQDIRNLLIVKEKPDPKNSKKTIPVLRFDEQLLNQKLGLYAEKVEQKTNSEYNYHDARIAIYSQFFGNYRVKAEIPSGSSNKVLGAETSVPDNGPKIAYLTFDDGPNSIYHPMILDILKKYNIKATFFLIGNNSLTNTDMVKRTLAEGHKIGNHTLTHPFLPNLTSNGILREIDQTDNVLDKLTGTQISMFRPPYGGVNLNVKHVADSLGLKLYLWDVDPRDWSEPAVDELVNRVVENTKNGSDILMHSNHLVTARALPIIIEKLEAKGFGFGLLN